MFLEPKRIRTRIKRRLRRLDFSNKHMKKIQEMNLPLYIYAPDCYWAQMITLRCAAACPYCIVEGRGKSIKAPEISGKEIVDFWNSIPHPKGQYLSLIGGETTQHRDFVYIINDIDKDYDVTVTTNLGGPFYKEGFEEELKPKCTLRINTSFHPEFIDADTFCQRIKKLENAGFFVDAKAMVPHPLCDVPSCEICKTGECPKDIPLSEWWGKHWVTFQKYGYELSPGVFLGFFDSDNKRPLRNYAKGSFHPNERWNDMRYAASRCGIKDVERYRKQCGAGSKSTVKCKIRQKTFLVGPQGEFFDCHYKLYYDIDPYTDINELKIDNSPDIECRHFGYCNWCDFPRACQTTPYYNPEQLDLPFLDPEKEKKRHEIQYELEKIRTFCDENDLVLDENDAVEAIFFVLYSGVPHGGHMLFIGNSDWPILKYLKSIGHKVTSFNDRIHGKFDIALCCHNNYDDIEDLKSYLYPGGYIYSIGKDSRSCEVVR